MATRVFLAIDNCFASKRWCEVPEWMRIVAGMGLRYVEASADNEIDPLYSCPAYLQDWVQEVRRESERTGVRVINCYSGHGTYSTLGLGHHDARVRAHLEQNWVEPMLRNAGALGAGLGFFAHAFSEKILRDRKLYDEAYERLIGSLQQLSCAAERAGVRTFSVEQMYTPHQVPWTISGTAEFLVRANAKSAGLPVYITLDTGHQSGQPLFCPPAAEQIEQFAQAVKAGSQTSIYLGPQECYGEFSQRVLAGISTAQLLREIETFVAEHPYLFSRAGDGDTYRWIESYAAFSPIIHLQQTDGKSSAHTCFTRELNAAGVIFAPKVLWAIHAGVHRPRPAGFPPPVAEIYLTLEPFLGTAAHPRVMLEEIAESVRYWRQYVPNDGVDIDALVANLPHSQN